MVDLQHLFEGQGLIPVFDYDNVSGTSISWANDINDNGQIVGMLTQIENGIGQGYHGFRYTPAAVSPTGEPELDILPSSGYNGQDGCGPQAINDNGVMTGGAGGDVGSLYAGVWSGSPGGQIDLLVLGPGQPDYVYGYLGQDINDGGQVAGRSNYWAEAWRWTEGSGFEDLGCLFDRNCLSSAFAINNSGDVGGTCRYKKGSSVTFYAWRFTDQGGLKDLGNLGGSNSQSMSINDFGDVVGFSEIGNGTPHVFIYTDEFGMCDLEASVVNLNADVDGLIHGGLQINDNGVICGYAGDGTGTQPSLLGHAYEGFILTPVIE